MNLSKYRKTADRGASALKEGLWVLARGIVFLVPFPLPSALRAAVLRAFGATIGAGFVIRAGVNISMPWKLRVGDHVWIGEGVRILSLEEVRIGSNVCISQDVFLCAGSHDFEREEFDLVVEPIVVRDRSWIAARAFVGPGVSIGPDSVVGANSTVLRDVPEKSLVAGNPAKVIREIGARG